MKMPKMDGITFLRSLRSRGCETPMIMMTAFGTIDSAVEAMRLGAFDYVKKPCDISVLMAKINNAYDKKHAMEEKIRKAQIDKIIRHPMAVFDKEE